MFRLPISTVLIGTALVVAAGCNRSDRPATQGEANREATGRSTGTALVRYVNLMDAHANTDLYFGDLKVFSGPSGDQPTGYKEVPSERRNFAIREAGRPDGVEIEKNSEGLSTGKHYTAIAYENDKSDPELRVVNDDEDAPAAGKAKIRLVHAAAKMEPVDVYVPGAKDKLISESRFGTVADWKEVNPVSAPVEVRVGGEKSAVRATVSGGIEPGKLYTFIVGQKGTDQIRVVRKVDMVNNTQ
jgi:hypothetical protein